MNRDKVLVITTVVYLDDREINEWINRTRILSSDQIVRLRELGKITIKRTSNSQTTYELKAYGK